jgi:hypothetical protein
MSNDIRKFMNLMEAPEWERDEAGRVSHPDISYDIGADKAIANLKSYNSQSYTKLAQKLERIKQLSEEVDQLKEEVKAETKEGVADLFAAEDAARTRIVETVSFIFQMSKNPKETVTPKYKDILEELSKSMTPELIKVMEGLKKTMVTTVQKSPTLKVTAKESINEGVWDALKGYLAGFLAKVQAWGTKYDSKLAALKAQANVSESEGFEDNATELEENDSDFTVGTSITYTAVHESPPGSYEGKIVKLLPNNEAVIDWNGRSPKGIAHVVDLHNCRTNGQVNRANAMANVDEAEGDFYVGAGITYTATEESPPATYTGTIFKMLPNGEAAVEWDGGRGPRSGTPVVQLHHCRTNAMANKENGMAATNEAELDEYAPAASTPEAYMNIITLAVQHGRLHQAEMELDDFKHNHPEAAEAFIASPAGQAIQAELAESVVEGIDYGRVDRIEKQVDFMAGRGRSRDEIVANISTKMGDDEGEHAATYFDAVHGVSEDAVRAGTYDPKTREVTRPGKDDPEGRKALAKDVKDQRGRYQQAVKDGNTHKNAARGAQSGSANYDIDRKYKPGHDVSSPWTTSKRVKETMAEMDISEDDLDSSEDRLMREYEEMMETMAFRVGQVVYCGSRAGRVIGDVPGVPDAILVQLPNGEEDAFKKKDCSAQKPGLLKKAAHWMVGEDGAPELALAGDEAHTGNKPDADGKLWVHSYKQWIDHSKYFAGAKPSLSGHEITAYDKTGARKMAGIWDLQGRKGWIDTTLYAKYKMKEDDMQADGDEAGLTEWDDDYEDMRRDDARSDAADEARSRAEEEAIQSANWSSGDYDVDVPFSSMEAFAKFIQLDFKDEKLTSMDDIAELFDRDWAAVSQAKAIVVRGDGTYCYKGDGGNFNEIKFLPKVLQDKLDQFVDQSREEAIEAYNDSYEPDYDDAGRGYGGF